MDLEFIKVIMMSFFCGTAIGLERQLKGRPAGIRTSSLVCLGTSCFVYLGVHVGSDATHAVRIMSAVITGVGFLGAGVILNRRGHVKGVTSAAVIWALATIGCYVGMSKFLESAIITAIVIMVLMTVQALEKWSSRLRTGMYSHDVLEEPKTMDEESH